MLKEKLMDALRSAATMYNGGMSANDAVAKSASDSHFNMDQAERLTEMFNSARTIDYFGKNASDRTGKFDIASKAGVVSSLLGETAANAGSGTERRPGAKKMEKKSSGFRPIEYSFYAFDPPGRSPSSETSSRIGSEYLGKLAADSERRWSGGYSANTLSDIASDMSGSMKSASSAYSETAGMLRAKASMIIEKIAESVSRGFDADDRYAGFMVLCGSDWQRERLSSLCPSLEKLASDSAIRMTRADLIDDRPIARELEMSREADMLMNKAAEYDAESERFSKVAGKVDSKASEFLRPSSHASAEDMINVGAVYCTARGMNGLFKESQSGVSSIGESFSTMLPNNSDVGQERTLDSERGVMLEDLISNDPIISEADPHAVAEVYKSVLALSPRLGLNKEVIRSILRQSVNSVSMDVATAKLLSEIDSNVKDSHK